MGVLQCDPAGFVCWMGILCSSWSAMSRGSTYRSWLSPLGLDTVKCVKEGNIMVGRWGWMNKVSPNYPKLICFSLLSGVCFLWL